MSCFVFFSISRISGIVCSTKSFSLLASHAAHTCQCTQEVMAMTGVSDDSVHKKKPVTSIIIAALHQTLDEHHTMRRVLKAIGTLG